MNVRAVLSLDLTCAACGNPPVELRFDPQPVALAVVSKPDAPQRRTAVEARCANCGNSVLFGELPIRIEDA